MNTTQKTGRAARRGPGPALAARPELLVVVAVLALLMAGALIVLSALPEKPVDRRVEAGIAASAARWQAWGRHYTRAERAAAVDSARYRALGRYYDWLAYGARAASAATRWDALGTAWRFRYRRAQAAFAARWAAIGAWYVAQGLAG